MGEGTTMKPGDKVIYNGGDQSEAGIVLTSWLDEHGDEDCYVALFGQPDIPTGPEVIKPCVFRYYAKSLKLVESPAGRIEELEQLWLPCDQTIQCAICGWVDWEEDNPHSEECPLGYMEARRAETKAELLALIRDVPVEHLHGDYSVTVCKDDCPGCAWEKKRDALEDFADEDEPPSVT